jgi:hypothetical protein
MFPFIFDDERDLATLFALSITAVLILALTWNRYAIPPTPTVSMVNIGILVTVVFATWGAFAILVALDDWANRGSEEL